MSARARRLCRTPSTESTGWRYGRPYRAPAGQGGEESSVCTPLTSQLLRAVQLRAWSVASNRCGRCSHDIELLGQLLPVPQPRAAETKHGSGNPPHLVPRQVPCNWTHLILLSCKGLAVMRAHFNELQEQRLQSLQQRIQQPFDAQDPAHQDALRQLWGHAFPGVPCISLRHERWTEMGWQRDDPASDFRGAGFVALENLLFMAQASSFPLPT